MHDHIRQGWRSFKPLEKGLRGLETRHAAFAIAEFLDYLHVAAMFLDDETVIIGRKYREQLEELIERTWQLAEEHRVPAQAIAQHRRSQPAPAPQP